MFRYFIIHVHVFSISENFTDIPFDCSDILKCWSTISGEFTIYPEGIGALEVQCDMDTDTGGWTVRSLSS